MHHSLLESIDISFFKKLFLGIAEPGNYLGQLLAHRFEATFLMRVLGTPPSQQFQYESLFREFLAYANILKLSMDWKLGLNFLEWSKKLNFVNSYEMHTLILSRAAYRWINTPYHDRDYKYVIISDYPDLPFWIIGQRSLHPLNTPKLYKVKPKEELFLKGTRYALTKVISTNNFCWQTI
jgi:hypothetical protein